MLGGDYVTWGDRKFVGPSAEALAALHAPHGVFAILGNHDDDHDMPAALSAGGVEVLSDARTGCASATKSLELAGIRFWTKRAADISAVVRGAAGPVILLAHDPRRLTEAAALRIPLVLSGHTHGGQVVLPVIGAVAARKFPVIAGVARQDDTTIFVSRGVGTVYVPVRINCPPEVALLTLAPARERLSVRPRRPTAGWPTRSHEPAAFDSPAAVEHHRDRRRIQPVLFDQDPRRQRLRRCHRRHRHRRLQDDRPAIEPGGHEVHRRAAHAHAVRERLRLGIEAGKRRQQRRMDVQDPIGKGVEQRRADQPHEAGETDQPDVVRLQRLRQRLIVGVTRARGRAAAPSCASMPASRARSRPAASGTIRDHHRDRGIERAPGDGVDDRLKVAAAPGNQARRGGGSRLIPHGAVAGFDLAQHDGAVSRRQHQELQNTVPV